jgi:hypothetical protein
VSDEDIISRIDNAVSLLREHFDAVQILVSWRDADSRGTKNCYRGLGNWYARQGMAHEFIEQDKAQEHAHQISEKLKPNDDGECSF